MGNAVMLSLNLKATRTTFARSSAWLWAHGEPCLFWAVVWAYLIPIWAFRFFPTQDGPVHLSTSIILKDYGTAGTRYREFFELRRQPIPNWTAQLLLGCLMLLVPPLIAEKLLVSIFVLGFAFSLRYFCGAFGPRARPCALLGLLFVYNRCLWLGFYNYNLSLALCLATLGYFLRRGEKTGAAMAGVLCLLLVATYFTHLVGFVVAAAGLGWLALTLPRQPLRHLAWLVLSIVPAGLLTLNYLQQTGFLGSSAATSLLDHFTVVPDFAALDREYFAHHVQGLVPMGWIAGAAYAVWATASVFAGNTKEAPAAFPGARSALALLALVFVLVYLSVPDSLGKHGSFLKARLALFPPLLVLGGLVESSRQGVRLALRGFVALVLLANLGLVVRRVAADNDVLAEYTAGIASAGTEQRLFILQHTFAPGTFREMYTADPLWHASHYYCLDTRNMNLDNYQAETNHFPLRFRDGITPGRALFLDSENAQDVDRVLAWEIDPKPAILESFESVFRRGRLEIFAKRRP